MLARAAALQSALDDDLGALRFDGADPASTDALVGRYLLPPQFAYLNHASIGTTPRAVHEAHVGYLALCETSPSLYVWGEPWRTLAEQIRSQAASLLGAAADDLAITHNTTEGFNILAHGLPLQPGDEVLFSDLNHPGASLPWQRMAPRRGYTVRTFRVPAAEIRDADAAQIVEWHRQALGSRTRVLVVPHVDNVVGLRTPLGALAEMARARGVRWVVADGAQAVGMMPVDLPRSGVDAYAASAHKWLQSPKGLGLFWATPETRRQLPPMWHRSSDEDLDGSARQYEDYSTRAWPAVMALGDSLDFQAALGEDDKLLRHRAARVRMHERVAAEPGLRWQSPTSWARGSAIVAVAVTGVGAADIGRRLAAHDVDARVFGGAWNHVRLAPNINTPDAHIDRVLDVLAGAA